MRSRLELAISDLGETRLKNIAEPMHIYSLQVGGATAAKATASTGTAPGLSLPDKPSIAVLPFQNMSGDPEQEYFADGTVEDIITALSHFRQLFVIARNSSFVYKGRAVDVKQVSRHLGVRYLLEGSVRKAANRILRSWSWMVNKPRNSPPGRGGEPKDSFESRVSRFELKPDTLCVSVVNTFLLNLHCGLLDCRA